jgi:hypothetical protein
MFGVGIGVECSDARRVDISSRRVSLVDRILDSNVLHSNSRDCVDATSDAVLTGHTL